MIREKQFCSVYGYKFYTHFQLYEAKKETTPEEI